MTHQVGKHIAAELKGYLNLDDVCYIGRKYQDQVIDNEEYIGIDDKKGDYGYLRYQDSVEHQYEEQAIRRTSSRRNATNITSALRFVAIAHNCDDMEAFEQLAVHTLMGLVFPEIANPKPVITLQSSTTNVAHIFEEEVSAYTEEPEDPTLWNNTVALVMIDFEVTYNFQHCCGLPDPTPPAGDCDPVTIENSDQSYSEEEDAGGTHVVPDTRISNSDDSYDVNQPSTIHKELPDIQAQNSDLSYDVATPAVQNVAIPDTRISNSNDSYDVNHPSATPHEVPNSSVKNSDNSYAVSFPSVTTHVLPDVNVKRTLGDDSVEIWITQPSQVEFLLSKIAIKDQADAIQGYYGAGKIIKGTNFDILSLVETATEIQIEADVAAQVGIAYKRICPQVHESYANGDTGWHVQNGTYGKANPVFPTHCAELDPDADEADVRGTYYGPAGDGTDSVYPTILKVADAGEVYRFVDMAGNPSDASTSWLFDHVNWRDHSWAGVPAGTSGVIHDRLHDLYLDTEYRTLDSAYSMDSAGTNGKSWDDWMVDVLAQGTHKTIDDWYHPSLEEAACLPHLYQGLVGSQTDWADKFFSVHYSGSRMGIITGHSLDANNFYPIYDSGNNDAVVELLKAKGSGFQHRLQTVLLIAQTP